VVFRRVRTENNDTHLDEIRMTGKKMPFRGIYGEIQVEINPWIINGLNCVLCTIHYRMIFFLVCIGRWRRHKCNKNNVITIIEIRYRVNVT